MKTTIIAIAVAAVGVTAAFAKPAPLNPEEQETDRSLATRKAFDALKSEYLNVHIIHTAAAAAVSPAMAKPEPFPLDRVRVTGGVFKEKQDIDKEYLLEFMTQERTDRLLAEFRRVAGLPAKAVRYPGRWEGAASMATSSATTSPRFPPAMRRRATNARRSGSTTSSMNSLPVRMRTATATL